MTKRRAIFGLACAIGFSAAGAARGETLEEVKKILHEKVSAMKSLKFRMEMKADMTMPPMTMKSTSEMTAEYLRKGDKVLSREESKTRGVQKYGETENKIDATNVKVSDGTYDYSFVDASGFKRATKSKTDPKVHSSPFDLNERFKELEKVHVVKLLPNETIDGKPTYVIEMTPKDPQTKALMGRMVTYYDQKTGITVKTVSYDAQGKVTSTMVTKDVEIDGKIDPERFVFKAPEGVKVEEVADEKP